MSEEKPSKSRMVQQLLMMGVPPKRAVAAPVLHGQGEGKEKAGGEGSSAKRGRRHSRFSLHTDDGTNVPPQQVVVGRQQVHGGNVNLKRTQTHRHPDTRKDTGTHDVHNGS